MKRSAVTIVVLVGALAAASVPAGATSAGDECPRTNAGYANTFMRAADPDGDSITELIWGGAVYCPGTTVDINVVKLTEVGSRSPPSFAIDQPCDSELTKVCKIQGAREEGTGIYQVEMRFDTETSEDLRRTQRFLWPGAGQPVPICNSAGVTGVNAGACPGTPTP